MTRKSGKNFTHFDGENVYTEMQKREQFKTSLISLRDKKMHLVIVSCIPCERPELILEVSICSSKGQRPMNMHCENKRLSLLIRSIIFSRRYPKEGRMGRQGFPPSTRISSFNPYITRHDWIVGVLHSILKLPKG